MTHLALSHQMDELLQSLYPADQPGAAVIVMQAGQPLLRKGYGLAHLELGVPVDPAMLFRIGSVTKQFTAVCILMLLEQGKLSLQDDLTRYLPDYPTGGRTITIEHLLTHTSGIKSYTSLPEWYPLWRKDLTLDELIALFKDQPFDFEPGEKFQYNNSGYILLGAIIEKISGMPYARFLQTQIFDRLGLTHTLYDDTARLVPGRVAGYSKGLDGLINTPYLSMTHPYAAGALISNVDDLARWNAALTAGELLRPETLALAFQPYHLNNGDSTHYGYGWSIWEYAGDTFVEHGGGINGFACGAVRVPAAGVYVALLTNQDDSINDPNLVAFKLAAMAIGKPYADPAPIDLPAEALAEYVGVYAINEKEERVVTCEDGQLYSQRAGGARLRLYPYAEDAFFIKESAGDRLCFERAADGCVSGMQISRRLGSVERAPKTDRPLPQPRTAIELDPAALGRYVGAFELAPGMTLMVTLTDGQLYLQAPGQEKIALFAETSERLFPTAAALTLDYNFDAWGHVTGFVLTQGPETYPCRKID